MPVAQEQAGEPSPPRPLSTSCPAPPENAGAVLLAGLSPYGSFPYSPGERAADAVVHVLGVSAGLAGCIALAVTLPEPIGSRLAIALYAAGLAAMLWCSALYNMVRDGPWKPLLRRLDHAAIFVMIAGTYTPITLIAMEGTRSRWLLGFVWAGALSGAALKLLAPGRIQRFAIAGYLLLGWAGIAALDRLLVALPLPDLLLLMAGGLLYSLGVLIHLARRLPYHNAIWHAFVLAAAACHYVVILRLAATAGG